MELADVCVEGKLTACLRVSQFLYINASFSPAPDDTVANLFKVSSTCCSLCTSADEKLPHSASQQKAI